MSDPKRNLDIRARRALKPPFTYQHGYIFDAEGNMAADNIHALRITGWGRLGAMEDGTELQDAIGERIARILSEHWNSAWTPKSPSIKGW